MTALMGILLACSRAQTTTASLKATVTPMQTLKPVASGTPWTQSNMPTELEAQRSAAAENCPGSMAAGGPFWSQATGVVLFETATTDTIFPWERRPHYVTLEFCDERVGQRLIELTGGGQTLPRAIVGGPGGPRFVMAGVRVRNAGEGYYKLYFRDIRITPPQ
jgi:hypothetical protein